MLIIHYMYLNICQAMRGVGSVWGGGGNIWIVYYEK